MSGTNDKAQPGHSPRHATAQHTSLEREFFAAVPPRQAPLLRRLRWWLLLRAVSLRPVQVFLEKRNRP
jgi:hypothetical protein